MNYYWYVYKNEEEDEVLIFCRHETGTCTEIYDNRMEEINCFNVMQEQDYKEWKESCDEWGDNYYGDR